MSVLTSCQASVETKMEEENVTVVTVRGPVRVAIVVMNQIACIRMYSMHTKNTKV